jgi:hypothetical protein
MDLKETGVESWNGLSWFTAAQLWTLVDKVTRLEVQFRAGNV